MAPVGNTRMQAVPFPAQRPRYPSAATMLRRRPKSPRPSALPVCCARRTRSSGATTDLLATPPMPPAITVCHVRRPGTGIVAEPRSLPPHSGSAPRAAQRAATAWSEASGTNSKARSNSTRSMVPSPDVSTRAMNFFASASDAPGTPRRRSIAATSAAVAFPLPSVSTAWNAAHTLPRSKSFWNSLSVRDDASSSSGSTRANKSSTNLRWASGLPSGSAFSALSAVTNSEPSMVPELSASCFRNTASTLRRCSCSSIVVCTAR
mmetsp:Transcript_23341/g.60879  ORF Transcript_23341/g.60879 Transcript_23341/m.60879 type:complete len:263 (-) Transcript_23341:75-863(-)